MNLLTKQEQLHTSNKLKDTYLHFLRKRYPLEELNTQLALLELLTTRDLERVLARCPTHSPTQKYLKIETIQLLWRQHLNLLSTQRELLLEKTSLRLANLIVRKLSVEDKQKIITRAQLEKVNLHETKVRLATLDQDIRVSLLIENSILATTPIQLFDGAKKLESDYDVRLANTLMRRIQEDEATKQERSTSH